MPRLKGELTMACNGRIARMRRRSLKLTQAELADLAREDADPEVAVSQTTVSRIESGLAVDYRSFLAVAHALGLDLVTLGVSVQDRREIAAEEELRLAMEERLRVDGRGGEAPTRDGSVKSESGYAVYARLSGYHNKPVAAAAPVR